MPTPDQPTNTIPSLPTKPLIEGGSQGNVSVSDNDAMRYAFELSTRLIRCIDYHAMTHCLLSIVQSFPGVRNVSSYEVFDQQTKNTTGLQHQRELLFRRFPLSLDDDFEDENTHVLNLMLAENVDGISQLKEKSRSFMLLNIVKDVNPQRAILIEGELDEYHCTLLEGLYSVYASQTCLLDKKERDVLTHLLNRQSLNHVMSQILAYYRENKKIDTADASYSDVGTDVGTENGKCSYLAVLDIDHFKQINDSYGHLFGDEVLIHFANILKEQFRFSDFIFRFGGEEFLVVLNQTDAAGVVATLERFRKAVEQHAFPSGAVTVSAGYTFVDCEKSLSQLLEEADRAVYQAKESGRNTVVSFNEVKNSQPPRQSPDIELF